MTLIYIRFPSRGNSAGGSGTLFLCGSFGRRQTHENGEDPTTEEYENGEDFHQGQLWVGYDLRHDIFVRASKKKLFDLRFEKDLSWSHFLYGVDTP